jgi:hypothetical protein
MLAFDLVTFDVRLISRQTNEVASFARVASCHASLYIYTLLVSCKKKNRTFLRKKKKSTYAYIYNIALSLYFNINKIYSEEGKKSILEQ